MTRKINIEGWTADEITGILGMLAALNGAHLVELVEPTWEWMRPPICDATNNIKEAGLLSDGRMIILDMEHRWRDSMASHDEISIRSYILTPPAKKK